MVDLKAEPDRDAGGGDLDDELRQGLHAPTVVDHANHEQKRATQQIGLDVTAEDRLLRHQYRDRESDADSERYRDPAEQRHVGAPTDLALVGPIDRTHRARKSADERRRQESDDGSDQCRDELGNTGHGAA